MRIGHISDLHVGKTDDDIPALRSLVLRLAELNLDGLVVSGDLIEFPNDLESQSAVRSILESCRLPFWAVPGNHDVATPGDNHAFDADFGSTPRVERLGEAAFALFDSFGGLPVASRSEEDHECYANTGCWLDGLVPASQFEALADAFTDADRVRLAVVHHHIEASPDAKVNALLNASEFLRWCRENRVEHIFVGHLHETAEAADLGGVQRLRIGKSTRAPYPIGVLDLADGSYTIHDTSAA